MKLRYFPLFLCVLLAQPLLAESAEDSLRKTMKTAIPNMEPVSIKQTPIAGLYEVNYGMQIYYVSADGEYIIDGDLIHLKTRSSLTSNAIAKARKSRIDAVSTDEMIVFPANGETRHVITVFTDIDCGYCRKLHNQMAEYNDLGIEVRYMLFPRAGLNSDSYKKAVSAWCASDKADKLTMAKQGKSIDALSCDNPVASQYQLGQEIGVSGTPNIVTESGQLIPGYRKPADMLQTLNQLAAVGG